DLSHGGLAIAASEMAFGGDVGVRLGLPRSKLRFDVDLFSESNGRWLVEARKGRDAEFVRAMASVPVAAIGRVGGTEIVIARGNETVRLPLAAARKAWSEALPDLVVVS